MTDANHIGDRDELVVGDNDHGDALPELKCGSCGVPWVDHMGIMGVCADNAALREDLKASLEAHDEMRQEITTQRIEIERLSAAVVKLSQSSLPENVEISILRKERDEARRMYCMEKANPPPVNYSHPVSHNAVASHHNWDCFKEKPMDNESDIVVRLRSWTEGIYYDVDSELIEAADEIERLRKERDEARREACEYLSCYYGKNSAIIEAQNTAERRGWDCYKKEETQ